MDSLKFDINQKELKALKELDQLISKAKNNNEKESQQETNEISNNDIEDINHTLEEIDKLKVLIYHKKKLIENKKFEDEIYNNISKIYIDLTEISLTENITLDNIKTLKKRINNINNINNK